MTVNFRRWVAVVALWLLITAGNPAKTYANDGLKKERYLGALNTALTERNAIGFCNGNDNNPLRPSVLLGTIEAIENRNPVTVVSDSNSVTLKAFYATDASALLTKLIERSDMKITLEAETRSIVNNQGRILSVRPTGSLTAVGHFVDLTARCQRVVSSFVENCMEQELEIERRLSTPASFATTSTAVPVKPASYSRPPIIPKRPERKRTILKQTSGSNIRILVIEPEESVSSSPTTIIDRGFMSFFPTGGIGCVYFGEYNRYDLARIEQSSRTDMDDQIIRHGSLSNLINLYSDLTLFLKRWSRLDCMGDSAFRSSKALVKPAKTVFASFKSPSIGRSPAKTMFSAIGSIAKTVKHFVGPYWNSVQTFDLLKRIQSIPTLFFSAMWPEYLGRSVSPYGILL